VTVTNPRLQSMQAHLLRPRSTVTVACPAASHHRPNAIATAERRHRHHAPMTIVARKVNVVAKAQGDVATTVSVATTRTART